MVIDQDEFVAPRIIDNPELDMDGYYSENDI